MALFSKKEEKKDKVEKKEVKETTESKVVAPSSKNLSDVILNPRITEKAAISADDNNAYTFEISKDANKKDVALAIEKIYKVTPVKVNITKLPRKVVRNRKGFGFKGGVKKAIVYLKKGDSIEFV